MSLVGYLETLGGVASVGSLKAQGFGPGLLRGAARSGIIRTIRKGWLALPEADPHLVRAVALGGRLGCVSAARYRGLWVEHDPDELHVAIPRHSGRATAHLDRDIVSHWQSPNWSGTGSVLESPGAMALQLATCVPSELAIATLDSALHRGVMGRQELANSLSESRQDLSHIVSSLDARSESGLESLCRVRLSRMGLAVRSQVFIDGVGRVDLLVGDRLVIEADGKEWHDSPNAFKVDRERDLRLALLGYTVLRLTYAQIIHEWPLVELSIRAIVARRAHRWA